MRELIAALETIGSDASLCRGAKKGALEALLGQLPLEKGVKHAMAQGDRALLMAQINKDGDPPPITTDSNVGCPNTHGDWEDDEDGEKNKT
ncbi:hypothetical protein [Oleiagrimonas sp. C23AA]|uniref:hypothetical protein n=1 Tax=Oleiagrimonas sp. C23AA TaxID=2719047 RepID=UPI00142193B8|nr:hypothetical protein [Oleiagrimonas sp. C23AA]NII09845.1 hypothetical protein [Oleiagrimonas sp. C23AA]